MVGRTRGEIPRPLAEGRTRFETWRRRRKIGARIPAALWSLAADLAGVYGVSQTASVLRLDYYSLKKRLTSPGAPEQPAASGFVELPVGSLTVGGECVIEWEHASGDRMRVHWKGYEAPDLIALADHFWSGG